MIPHSCSRIAKLPATGNVQWTDDDGGFEMADLFRPKGARTGGHLRGAVLRPLRGSATMKVVEEYPDARITHEFEEMTREKRPQDDPERNGMGLRFLTLEHGGEYPDTMPQALKVTDREGRSCIYEPAEKLDPEARPQDPSLRGSGLKFKVLEYGGEYNDDMPMSICLTD